MTSDEELANLLYDNVALSLVKGWLVAYLVSTPRLRRGVIATSRHIIDVVGYNEPVEDNRQQSAAAT
jgi:hypothetical protein